jgi:hypothetical protein
MHPLSTTAVKEGGPRCPWQLAVAEFAQALGYSPPPPDGQEADPLEIGIIGLSGVGKSSLLNALVAPTRELLPAGGVGPLTGGAGAHPSRSRPDATGEVPRPGMATGRAREAR